MISILSKLLKNMLDLPRYVKILVVIAMDVSLCILSTWLAFYLRLEELVKFDNVTIFNPNNDLKMKLGLIFLLLARL